MKSVLVFFVVLVSALWAVNSRAGDDPQEIAAWEVAARLTLSAEVKAKVTAIFAEYKDKIEAREKEMDEAYRKTLDAKFASMKNKGSEDAVKAAQKKWDTATKLYSAAIHERDAKIKKALPPALAAAFERGMQLITERNAKKQAVSDEAFARIKQDLQEGKQITEEEQRKIDDEARKKYEAIDKEYDEKLDAQVGRLNEQK